MRRESREVMSELVAQLRKQVEERVLCQQTRIRVCLMERARIWIV